MALTIAATATFSGLAAGEAAIERMRADREADAMADASTIVAGFTAILRDVSDATDANRTAASRGRPASVTDADIASRIERRPPALPDTALEGWRYAPAEARVGTSPKGAEWGKLSVSAKPEICAMVHRIEPLIGCDGQRVWMDFGAIDRKAVEEEVAKAEKDTGTMGAEAPPPPWARH